MLVQLWGPPMAITSVMNSVAPAGSVESVIKNGNTMPHTRLRVLAIVIMKKGLKKFKQRSLFTAAKIRKKTRTMTLGSYLLYYKIS